MMRRAIPDYIVPPIGTPETDYDVYWCFHKKMFSLKNRDTGLVDMHCQSVLLKDVSFVVSKAGRKRVLRDKVKTVHAYARGILANVGLVAHLNFSHVISYNPYVNNCFVNSHKEEVRGARYVYLSAFNNKPYVIATDR